MDALDQLAGPGADLLGRVDDLLARAGAPDDHRIWPLLRRLRVLPGDAVRAVTALRPAPLASAGHAVRNLIREYDDAGEALTDGDSWRGAAADAFAAHRTALASHLTDGPDSLTGRLDATAGYAQAVADWAADSRAALARTLVGVLVSAEAVTVVTADLPGDRSARAAAEIGARVLASVAGAYDAGERLLARWAPSLAELPYQRSVEAVSRWDTTTWITG